MNENLRPKAHYLKFLEVDLHPKKVSSSFLSKRLVVYLVVKKVSSCFHG